MGIPKKIIFSAPDKNNLHPKVKKNLDNLSAKNQDWEILVFDDNDIANFIKENFDNFYLDLFKIVNPKLGPAKADLFRYLYILKNGGVYLDLKSTINPRLNDIIKKDDDFIVSSWGKTHSGWGIHKEIGKIKEFQQWFIISSPNNDIFRSLIDRCILNLSFYNKGIFGLGKNGVVRSTGPIPFTQEMIRAKKRNWRRINSEDDGLVYSIFGSGFRDHEVAFNQHYIDSQEEVVSSGVVEFRTSHKDLIQQAISRNEKKIHSTSPEIGNKNFDEYEIEELKSIFNLNPTNFKLLVTLTKKMVKFQQSKEAIDFLKRQIMLRPYCKQSYELVFEAQENIKDQRN